MKKCIMFVFLIMLFLLIGPEPKKVGVQRKTSDMTIEEKDTTPGLANMIINQNEEGMVEEDAIVFVEIICERNTAVTPVKLRNVVLRPKFRVQSARMSVDDGTSFICM